MPSLRDEHRSLLERVCVAARGVSEVGSLAALESLGVERPEPYGHLSPDQRDLRVRLRARARQLGDKRFADGRHEIGHLVEEAGYEQWHRMLFARFLAENGLLIHPSQGVPVSLEECEELAEAEGAADGWDLAARYAGRMLPEIFRSDAPTLELKLAPEHEQGLESLLESLPPELFRASDALGWVYQYWQSDKKNEVNKSEVKIGADKLAPVTQLFTEPYMVQFLLHNSLGAWWASRHRVEELPVELTYFRTLEDGTPAAGTFEGWPDRAAELRVLDPCCGSGHFLVEAFRLLVPMRMLEEGLSAPEAGDAVLRDNIYGLELDARCTEIAAFALALAAWTYPAAEGYRPLPELNVACSGLAVGASKRDWEKFAGGDERLKAGMGRLWELFKDAPTFGSLIDPTRGLKEEQTDALTAEWHELQPLLQKALAEEDPRDYEGQELGVTAQGIAKAAQLLAAQYHLVTTNVPYLKRGNQDQKLRDFCESHYGLSKNDLATAFLERCLEACVDSGTASIVLPQNWLFLTTYAAFRAHLLNDMTLDVIAKLGPGAFRGIGGEVVNVVLLGVSRRRPSNHHEFSGLSVEAKEGPGIKAAALTTEELVSVPQQRQLANPDSVISILALKHGELMGLFCECLQGTSTGDNPRLVSQFWEMPMILGGWCRFQVAPGATRTYGGRESLAQWDAICDSAGSAIRGRLAWGNLGVAVGQMTNLPATLYSGDKFANTTPVIIPNRKEDLPAVWSYCSSAEFADDLRQLNPKLSVDNGYISKIVFDVEHWRQVAAEQYPDGLPEPYSEDPTQWIFQGTVTPTEAPLQVAVARLLGYRWPEQADDGLADLVDDDGIVCIPAVRGEQPAAARLQQLLAQAYGDDWKPGLTETLLAEVGYQGKTLDDWLRDGFFPQHCELFHQRPFIWHIWDGRKKDGFHALVNYHQLDEKRLKTLTFTYLGDWIRRQQEELKQEKGGAEGRLEAAQELQRRLELILEGEDPYDIFVRWKPIEEQPIGWEPDLNDGVRMNIRPFMEGDVLRRKPKIKWKKDRGKDPEDAPWYHLFEGDRINDHHLTLDDKQAACNTAGVVS